MAMRAVFRVLLALLPKRTLTRLAGWICDQPFSRYAIPYYIMLYQIDREEIDLPIALYPTLNAFFARKVKRNVLSTALDAQAICSPCDGIVLQSGTIDDQIRLPVKKMTISVAELLGVAMANAYLDGFYAIIYLSPRDYHRFHAPFACEIDAVRTIAGGYDPVNRLGRMANEALYARNTRIVFEGHQAGKRFALIAVGSLMVGSVKIASSLQGALPQVVQCGEEMGYFQFGSTVILLLDRFFDPIALDQEQRVYCREVFGEKVR